MPGRLTPVRLLEKCLVVVQAHCIDSHQFRRNPSESFRQHKSTNVFVVLPQVHYLQERLAVGVALGEGPILPVLSEGD